LDQKRFLDAEGTRERRAGADKMSVTLYCDESKYSWDINKKGPDYVYLCIAGLIVPAEAESALVSELCKFKKRFFGAKTKPELIELKGRDFSNKKGAFSHFTDEMMNSFSRELSCLLFQKFHIRVLATCNKESAFGNSKRVSLSRQLELPPYEYATFQLFVRYNTYLMNKGLKGKIVFDEGNMNVLRLLSWMKKDEVRKAFDLSSCINLQGDTEYFFDKSERNQLLQVADLCAYTNAFFYAMTHLDNGTVAANRINRFEQIKCPVGIPELNDAWIERPENVSMGFGPITTG
jgi:hypothetical protein